MKSVEASQASNVANAKREESQRILKEIKDVLPAPQYIRFFNGGAQRFVQEIKKVVNKEES
jgi:hypothetical protein